MRSTRPIPGNPWPHDMVLSIENAHQGVLDLLWVRASLQLTPLGDVPPPVELPVPAATLPTLRQDRREWDAAWTPMWFAVLEHAGQPNEHIHRALDAARAAPLGSDERRDLFESISGPSWRQQFGDAAFDDAYDRWVEDVQRQNIDEHTLRLDQHPERRCLDALIPAWERGLTTIVTIPCSGDYTRTVSPTGLCLTRAARDDPDRYREALHSFGR